MSNLVLYRKYRPKSFSEIVGQEHIVRTLTNAVSREMVSHAYLFSGPRGTGKTTTARLFAKSLNCHNRKEGKAEPCNKCPSCLDIINGRSLDLIEIDAASHRGIDEIRELREGIKFSPAKEKYKVFILDEAHQLSKDAVNALLKTLEEPPPHAIFVLATTEVHKMLPTIISRCQRFDFRKLKLPEIEQRMSYICKKEGVKIDKAALELIALNSGGAVRDAESLLDQVLTFAYTVNSEEIKAEKVRDILGIADNSLISQFLEHIRNNNSAEALKFLNQIMEKGFDPQEFARALVRYLRRLLILEINPEDENPIILGLTGEEKKFFKEQAKSFGGEKIHKMIDLFLDAENKMRYSSIPQLPLELAIVDITEKEK